MLKAGLLTYSRFSVFPYRLSGTVTYRLKNVIELTAAGQLQIYTVFPFNPDFTSGTKSSANVVKRAESGKPAVEND
jgi:hypothetical protein